MAGVIQTIKNKPVYVTVGTIIVVFIFIMTMTAKFITTLNNIESNLRHLNGKTDLYNERWSEVLSKQAELDKELIIVKMQIAEIQRRCEY